VGREKNRLVARNLGGRPVPTAPIPEGDPVGTPSDRDEEPAAIEPGEVSERLTSIKELAHCVL
jgi:hypothetical protein